MAITVVRRERNITHSAMPDGRDVDVESNHLLPPGLASASAGNASTPKRARKYSPHNRLAGPILRVVSQQPAGFRSNLAARAAFASKPRAAAQSNGLFAPAALRGRRHTIAILSARVRK